VKAGLTRRAYRRTEVRDLYGASLRAIDRAVGQGLIRTRRYGRCVFIHPGDVERLFGFEVEESTPSLESVAEIRELLA
jgi:hypothetical protein